MTKCDECDEAKNKMKCGSIISHEGSKEGGGVKHFREIAYKTSRLGDH